MVVVGRPADGQPRGVDPLQVETPGDGPMRIGLGRKDDRAGDRRRYRLAAGGMTT